MFLHYPPFFFCCCFVLFWPHGMWDLNFLTRDQTMLHAVEAQSFHHWTTKKVPMIYSYFFFLIYYLLVVLLYILLLGRYFLSIVPYATRYVFLLYFQFTSALSFFGDFPLFITCFLLELVIWL